MQITRLFEIVYILLEKKNVTAKELAGHFEVSQRTIYRDIEALCEAGIPIYANRGKGGGICLMENFVLNKSVLTKQEQNDILSALQGIHATSYEGASSTLAKLRTLFQSEKPDWIEVDFSYWNSGEEDRRNFTRLKDAILNRRVITFTYYNSYGQETSRKVWPLKLVFKGQAWYLLAYCTEKLDIRYFKISRMENLSVSEETFGNSSQIIPQYDIHKKNGPEESGHNPRPEPRIMLTLRVDKEMAYRVYDEFPKAAVTRLENGGFLIHSEMQSGAWLYGYLLSYEGHLEVLEPEGVREGLIQIVEKLNKIYNI